MLSRSKITTPVGDLFLIANDSVLLAAGFSSYSNLHKRLDAADAKLQFKEVKSIPKVSELISDYFDGDFSAINAIEVRQPGMSFYQSIRRQMRKIPAGKTWTYSELLS